MSTPPVPSPRRHRIAVLRGDGVGPEVTQAALTVLDAAGGPPRLVQSGEPYPSAAPPVATSATSPSPVPRTDGAFTLGARVAGT